MIKYTITNKNDDTMKRIFYTRKAAKEFIETITQMYKDMGEDIELIIEQEKVR